jgi:hypothetical protein
MSSSSSQQDSCAPPIPYWSCWKWFKAFAVEFGACFLFGFLIDVAQAVQVSSGGPAFTSFEIGGAAFLLYLATAFTYLKWFHVVPHLTPSNTLIDCFYDAPRDGKTPWTYWVSSLAITVGSFTGRLVGQASATVIYPWDLASSTPEANADLSFGSLFFLFFLVLAAWGAVLAFVERKVYSAWLVFAAAAIVGLNTALFRHITGGSNSIYQSVSSMIVFGHDDLTPWGPELLALFVAWIFICVARMFVFGIETTPR